MSQSIRQAIEPNLHRRNTSARNSSVVEVSLSPKLEKSRGTKDVGAIELPAITVTGKWSTVKKEASESFTVS